MDWKHYLDYNNVFLNVVEILWKHPKILATLSTTNYLYKSTKWLGN